MQGMSEHRKDEGGAAGLLAVSCVVVLGLFVVAGGWYALTFMAALHQARSRAAAAQVEQQAQRARAVKQEIEAAIEAQKELEIAGTPSKKE